MKYFSLFILFILLIPQAVAKNIAFIVNAENPVSSLSAYEVSQIFLKKNRSWPNGEAIRFFDRRDDSIERKIFLSTIMRRSSRELDQYWIGQKLYTGNSAPSQLVSDKMAISMVSRFPGAISYVLEENFKETEGIKRINVTGTP